MLYKVTRVAKEIQRQKLGLRKESNSQTPRKPSLSISSLCYSIHICFILLSLTANWFSLLPGLQGGKWLSTAREFPSPPSFNRVIKLRLESLSLSSKGRTERAYCFCLDQMPIPSLIICDQRTGSCLQTWCLEAHTCASRVVPKVLLRGVYCRLF